MPRVHLGTHAGTGGELCLPEESGCTLRGVASVGGQAGQHPGTGQAIQTSREAELGPKELLETDRRPRGSKGHEQARVPQAAIPISG